MFIKDLDVCAVGDRSVSRLELIQEKKDQTVLIYYNWQSNRTCLPC